MFEKGQVLKFENRVVVVLATIKTDAVIFYFVADRKDVFVLIEKNLQAKLSVKALNFIEISNKEKVEYEMLNLDISGAFVDDALDNEKPYIIE